MMGYTNIPTTQLYAKMLDEKVGRDMFSLREMFATSSDVAVKAMEDRINTDKTNAFDATALKMSADVAISCKKFRIAV